MSTAARLIELETDGKLFRFAPGLRHRFRRRLYLTAEAARNFHDPSSATNFLPRPQGMIEAAMTRWVSGGRIYTDEKGRPRFLKELDPPPCTDIWEIRVVEPTPSVRLIGGFLEQDTIILSSFRTRSFLGNKGSSNWQEAMSKCAADFRALFGHGPMRGDRLGDYVSENYDDFPLHR